MNWKRRNRLLSYLRSSLWVIPVGAAILVQIAGAFVAELDTRLAWGGAAFGVDGAKALCGAVITFSLSFVVFTFGSLLVAIQVASGQYTPRIIATTLLCDNVLRYTVGLFVFALLFAVKAQDHIEQNVPQLVVYVTGLLGLLCLVAFLYLIDYAARLLRPVSLVKRVGDQGLAVLASVYPGPFCAETFKEAVAHWAREAGAQEGEEKLARLGQRTVVHEGTSATVLALDVDRLIQEAAKADGVIEFSPQVGDFIGPDEPLFVLHGGATAITKETLQDCVIFGPERTMEQDPLFAFRILVDIAIKALSAAINDPTTAVLAIDQLHRLLRRAGRLTLHTDRIRDTDGALRVIVRTPDWEDFVKLAFTEIRCCGASNIQIARRLRAMIVNLANTLPSERQEALRQESVLLDRMLEAIYTLPEDLALARTPDSQGLGGSTGAVTAKWAA